MFYDFCQVAECRYPRTHLTCAHRCGNCGRFGHGQIECESPEAMQLLARRTSPLDRLDPAIHCTMPGCDSPSTHSAEAHHCGSCGSRGHSRRNCTSQGPWTFVSGSLQNLPTNVSALGTSPNISGTNLSPGISFISTNVFDPTLYQPYDPLVINNENDGEESQRERSEQQIEEHQDEREQERVLTIKCPLCSVYSTVSTTQATAHVDLIGECVHCMEENAQVFLNACGHINLCWNCAKRFSET